MMVTMMQIIIMTIVAVFGQHHSAADYGHIAGLGDDYSGAGGRGGGGGQTHDDL